MEKTEFEKLLKLRLKINKEASAIEKQLVKLDKDLKEFYDKMRWGTLDFSDSEYSLLYSNCIYPYEEEDIGYAMAKLIDFCREVNSKNTIL